MGNSIRRTVRLATAVAALLGGAIVFASPTRVDQLVRTGNDDGSVPSLRDQHYAYLVRQMRSLAASHRLNVDADLIRFIDSLDTEEMTAVADYLSRLRGPVRDRAKLRDDGKLRD